jgi:hypothetical protein
MKLKRNKFVRKKVYSFRVDSAAQDFTIRIDGSSNCHHYGGEFYEIYKQVNSQSFVKGFWAARKIVSKHGWTFSYYKKESP